MTVLVYLMPLALLLGLAGLAAFLWSLASGQYEDLDGAALRVLDDSDVDTGARSEERPVTALPTVVSFRAGAVECICPPGRGVGSLRF